MSADNIRYPRPERRGGYEPPLLRGVVEVVVGSLNPHKINGVRSLVERYGILHGSYYLHEPERTYGLPIFGEEPRWENPLLVAQHKRASTVQQLLGTFGKERLVVVNDVVVKIDGEARYNLSRDPVKDPHAEVKALVETFSQETKVTWDVAMSVSRPGVLASMVDRYVAWFKPIPHREIWEGFWGDIPGVFGRGPRLDLVRKFKPYIDKVLFVPVTWGYVEEVEFPPADQWSDRFEAIVDDRGHPPSQQELDNMEKAVIGGIPVAGREVDLFNLVPGYYSRERYI